LGKSFGKHLEIMQNLLQSFHCNWPWTHCKFIKYSSSPHNYWLTPFQCVQRHWTLIYHPLQNRIFQKFSFILRQVWFLFSISSALLGWVGLGKIWICYQSYLSNIVNTLNECTTDNHRHCHCPTTNLTELKLALCSVLKLRQLSCIFTAGHWVTQRHCITVLTSFSNCSTISLLSLSQAQRTARFWSCRHSFS